MRSADEPSQAIASVRRELQAIDPAMPPGVTVTLADYIGAAYLAQRTAALLLGALALLALILASVGRPLKSDNLVH